MTNDANQTPPTASITVNDREMTVRMPGPEQLAVWQRTVNRFQNMATEDMTDEMAAKVLDRVMRIIESVLADEKDRDWLEDQLLDGTMTLAEAGSIITRAAHAFQQQRQQAAPTNGPTKPAKRARRAAR